MSKYGVNVAKGVAVSSVPEVRKAIQEVFPNESELVVKSQILAGGRGLGTFKSGLKGGVHIVKADQVEEIAEYQIFRGLAYIHTVPGVCHRDVKPQIFWMILLPTKLRFVTLEVQKLW